MRAKNIALNFMKRGGEETDLDDVIKALTKRTSNSNLMECGLNPEFDPRSIVGDDYTNSAERYYGNNDCNGLIVFMHARGRYYCPSRKTA